MYTENFSAIATQAAVLAGFTTTCLIEVEIPKHTHPAFEAFLYISAIVSICSNITCVSLSTMTTVWGSGKALRGIDGSMDEAVDGMSKERNQIFYCFAIGLAGNLCTVFSVCLIAMKAPSCYITMLIVLYTGWMIYTNSNRIQRKFALVETVQLDDLTSFPYGGGRMYFTQVNDLAVPGPPPTVVLPCAPGLLGTSYRGKAPQDVV